MEYTFDYDSPLGTITLASDGVALTGLWFDGQKRFACTPDACCRTRMLPVFEETTRWLNLYFEGRDPGFTPPISPKGTSFQRGVWQTLLAVPFGETVTYGGIARMLAEKRGIPSMSAQAVGGAAARNPILLIIPCHRMTGSGGSLTGYAGGLDRKQRLLAMEKAALR